MKYLNRSFTLPTGHLVSISDPTGVPGWCSYWAKYKDGKITYWINPKLGNSIKAQLEEDLLCLSKP